MRGCELLPHGLREERPRGAGEKERQRALREEETPDISAAEEPHREEPQDHHHEGRAVLGR